MLVVQYMFKSQELLTLVPCSFYMFLLCVSFNPRSPLIIAPAMGANVDRLAELIGTIFFVSGISTLVQTTFGDRLPIVQGGSFSFLPATFSVIANPALQAIENDDERFLETMRVLQGAFIIVGIVQMVLGYTGKR